jgi:ubiquinone/menaquinone biosynthesis C-methylase UbiE
MGAHRPGFTEEWAMTDSDKVFSGSLPAIYERYLVPLLFEPYAEHLAQRLADLSHGNLLEIAAGTGVVTRALARSLSPAVEIVATDLNQPMLDLAALMLQGRRVSWQQADAVALPFADHEFDVVVSQFGVMFFPDKIAAFAEARRVLKIDGRFLFSVWDRIDENEFSHIVSEAVAARFPQDPPRFMARTPYAYNNAAAIEAALASAGFRDIEVETVERMSRAPSPHAAALGLCQGSPLRTEIEARDAAGLDAATDAAAAALAQRFGTGAIAGRMRALVIAARR